MDKIRINLYLIDIVENKYSDLINPYAAGG